MHFIQPWIIICQPCTEYVRRESLTRTAACCLPQPSTNRQRPNLRATQRALDAPVEGEGEVGLTQDPDVRAEAEKLRGRARAYLAAQQTQQGQAAGTGRRWLPAWGRRRTSAAPASVLPAEEAAAGGSEGKEGKGGASLSSDGGLGAEGTEGAVAAAGGGRPFAVEMFGLRKAYGRGLLRRRPFVAVRGNWLGIYEGEGVGGVEKMVSEGGWRVELGAR